LASAETSDPAIVDSEPNGRIVQPLVSRVLEIADSDTGGTLLDGPGPQSRDLQ
jgi:hypothetical protein